MSYPNYPYPPQGYPAHPSYPNPPQGYPTYPYPHPPPTHPHPHPHGVGYPPQPLPPTGQYPGYPGYPVGPVPGYPNVPPNVPPNLHATPVPHSTPTSLSATDNSDSSIPSDKDWIPSIPESQLIEEWFSSLDEGTGFVGGAKAAGFLKGSNVSVDSLRTIWGLVDVSNKGKVDRTQFTRIIRLVSIAKSPIYAGATPTMERYYKTIKDQFSLPTLPSSADKPAPVSEAPALPTPSTSIPSSATKPAAVEVEWLPAHTDLVKMDMWFDSLDVGRTGTIGGASAAGFLQASNLSRENLRTIWSLVDKENQGKISRQQFYKIIRYTALLCSPTHGSKPPSSELFSSTIHESITLPNLQPAAPAFPSPHQPPAGYSPYAAPPAGPPGVSPLAVQTGAYPSPIYGALLSPQAVSGYPPHGHPGIFQYPPAPVNVPANPSVDVDSEEFTEFTSAEDDFSEFSSAPVTVPAPQVSVVQLTATLGNTSSEPLFEVTANSSQVPAVPAVLPSVALPEVTIPQSKLDVFDMMEFEVVAPAPAPILMTTAETDDFEMGEFESAAGPATNQLSNFGAQEDLSLPSSAGGLVGLPAIVAIPVGSTDSTITPSASFGAKEFSFDIVDSSNGQKIEDASVPTGSTVGQDRMQVFDDLMETDSKTDADDWDDFAAADSGVGADSATAVITGVDVSKSVDLLVADIPNLPTSESNASIMATRPSFDAFDEIDVPVAPILPDLGNLQDNGATNSFGDFVTIQPSAAFEEDDFGDFVTTKPPVVVEEEDFGGFEVATDPSRTVDAPVELISNASAFDAFSTVESIPTTSFAGSEFDIISSATVPSSISASNDAFGDFEGTDDGFGDFEGSTAPVCAIVAASNEKSVVISDASKPTVLPAEINDTGAANELSLLDFDIIDTVAPGPAPAALQQTSSGFGADFGSMAFPPALVSTEPVPNVESLVTFNDNDFEFDAFESAPAPAQSTEIVSTDQFSFSAFDNDQDTFGSDDNFEFVSAPTPAPTPASIPTPVTLPSDVDVGSAKITIKSTAKAGPPKAATAEELDELIFSLFKRNFYEAAYSCTMHAAVVQSIQMLSEQKRIAVDNDDLETAIKMKNEITAATHKLVSVAQEQAWVALLEGKGKEESIPEMVDLVVSLNSKVGGRCKTRFVDNFPDSRSRAPTLDQLVFALRAKRSLRIITVVLTTHAEYPVYWKRLLESVGSILDDGVSKLAAFKKLSSTDQKQVFEEDKMKDFLSGLWAVANVGVWVAATCLECLANESLAGKVEEKCTLVTKAIKDLDQSATREPVPTTEQLLANAAELIGNDGVTYCNFTLRPLTVETQDHSIRNVLNCTTTSRDNKPYHQGLVQFWSHNIKEKLPKSDCDFI